MPAQPNGVSCGRPIDSISIRRFLFRIPKSEFRISLGLTVTLIFPWQANNWIQHTQTLLRSYRHWVGSELVDRAGSVEAQAERLFMADFVVVSHGTEDDPILNYGNQIALDLWELDIQTLRTTPSRMTAEPLHRNERALLLERTSRDGYVDDYRGIRISSSGKRFEIHRATVWNLIDESLQRVGQAATFSQWTRLDDAAWS